MLETFHYSTPIPLPPPSPRPPSSAEIKSNLKFNFYFGGSIPKFISPTMSGLDIEGRNLTWATPKLIKPRECKLSMAIQNQCSHLYFHISNNGFWLVEQMEAAYAIGCGRHVILCVEYLNNNANLLEEVSREADSQRSSGYSSLASTPDEVFQSSTELPSASSTTPSATSTIRSATLTITSARTILSSINTDFTNLPPELIKDHNRSRNYLKSLLEDSTRGSSRGLLLPRPVENVNDLLLYIL